MGDGDLDDFLHYIGSMWGALGGITAVFPLADVLLNVIPLPVDGYGNSTAPIATALTSMVAVFALLYTFVQRRRVESLTPARAGIFFVVGMLSLLTYLLLAHFEYRLRDNLFPGLDSTDDYLLLVVGVVPFYVAFFACLTRSFAVLALIEFNRRQKPRPGHARQE